MEQYVKANRSLGRQIKFFSRKKGITQEELAKRMVDMGCKVSRSAVSKIEIGARHVSVEELRCICEILDVDYNTLFNFPA